MIQGTTTDAGKSTLVSGLCRVLKNQGVRVAPFKPQNMALNSAVTSDGAEIGRAQAVQAAAAGLDPHSDMNPILIKPASDTGAQIIVQGKVFGNINAMEYQGFKNKAMDFVLESYERLHHQYEAVVVEGAGSPAEINLRENDVANMGFAEAVDCPVVLVADIDKGGVFAHIVGTLSLLSQSEQDRIVGFVINKFRGDIKLLESGLTWLEEKTKKPVLGVLPYIPDLQIESEDAISTVDFDSNENDLTQTKNTNEKCNLSSTIKNRLRVVIPVLPRISNHTDFDVLRYHPDIEVEFKKEAGHTLKADVVILPGSKAVIDDLDWLIKNGWNDAIAQHLRYGGKVIGICGGYQMLGRSISDPEQVESQRSESTGLGYLPVTTIMSSEKQLKQRNAYLRRSDGSDVELSGYEIHQGVSSLVADEQASYVIRYNDGDCLAVDGVFSGDDQVFGCYLHGLFDKPGALEYFLEWARPGLFKDSERETCVDIETLRERAFDNLAESIEQHIDLEQLTKLSGVRFVSR
ncbi:MAG: cobyric acid synthase [Agarilytica sp.]